MNKEEIATLRSQGFTFREIGEKLGYSTQYVFQVLNPERGKERLENWHKKLKQDPIRLEAYRKKCREYQRNYLKINGKNLRVKKRPRPDGVCEICGIKSRKLNYHHWDDNYPEQGIWVCGFCHPGVGFVERGFVTKYQEMKEAIKLDT